VRILRDLTRANPRYQGDLARSLNNLGFLRLILGQTDQARPLLEESLVLVRPLAGTSPTLRADMERTEANLRHLSR
jgi:hypothetical protein